MRRIVLVLVVASLLVLAGCAGEGVSDDESTLEDTDEAAQEAESESEAESEPDSESETDSEPEAEPETEDDAEPVDGDPELHHIDVGQADATLVIEPDGETMLIDTGDWRQDGSDVIAYLETHGIDRVDHLVATHGHADHIGGHAAVVEHLEENGNGVGAAYDSGVAHTSQTYDNYLDAIETHDVDLLEVAEGDTLEFGQADVEFFNPPAGDSGTDLHYNSVALTIAFGDVTYLTTGDAEEDAEQRMVEEYGEDLAADVYQAGHHGSSTSSTDPFLDTVDPEMTVISSAFDSQYGHPHDEVLESLSDRGLETYWTGVHGDVVLTTDGDRVDVETGHDGPTDGHELLAEKPEDDTSSLLEPTLPSVVSPLASTPPFDVAGSPLL